MEVAIAWAYGVALVGLLANWLAVAVWGVILWALAHLAMSTTGSMHAAIRKGEQEDPGPAATDFGAVTDKTLALWSGAKSARSGFVACLRSA